MALDSFTGAFTAPTSNGTQAISGLGFEPKLILIWYGATDDDMDLHYGAASSSAAGNQFVVSGFSDDNLSTSDVSRFANTGVIVTLLGSSQSIVCAASLQSIDSDGFTLNWTTTSSARDFRYICLAGASLDIEVGTVTLPNTTGNFSETGVGFQPKLVDFVMTSQPLGSSASLSSFFNIGSATSSSSRNCVFGVSRDNVSTTDTTRTQSSDRIITRLLTGASSIDIDVDFVSMDSDGFTCNAVLTIGTTQEVPYIAYGGNINVDIREILQQANGTQAITGLGFQPDFSFSKGTNSTDANNLSLGQNILAIGFSNSVDSAAYRHLDQDNLSTTNATTVISTSKIYIVGSGSAGLAEYTSNDADGYTLTWTNSDASPRRMFMTSIGDAATGISITEETVNTNYTSLDPVISLTGLVAITEETVNTNYTSLDPVITLTGTISIIEDTVNTNYTSLDPIIDLTGLVSIVEEAVNTNYTSLDPTITLTFGVIEITEDLVNTNYQSLDPTITLTPEPVGIVSTVCFNGIIEQLVFNGFISQLVFNGEIEAIEFNGKIINKQFNGSIQTLIFNGDVKQLVFNGTIQTTC